MGKPPYLRLLLALKARLLWRSLTRNTSAVVGAIFLLVFFGPLSIAAAVGGYAGFHTLSVVAQGHLLRAILLAAYLFWLVSPLFGIALTEEYDLGKLLPYPISARQILAGAVLGSVLDFGVLVLLPTLLVVALSFSKNLLAAPLVVLAIALFLFHTVTLSQAINLMSAGLLRSRRGRDVVAVLIPLLSVGVYLLSQIAPRRAMSVDWHQFLASRGWTAVGYSPPGLAAHAITAAAKGEALSAAGLLLVLAALTAATLALAGWLVNLVYTGESDHQARRKRPARPAATSARAAPTRPLLGLRLPPVVAAVLEKELKYYWREPFFKAMLLQIGYMVIVMVFAFRPWPGSGGGALFASPLGLWAASGMLVLAESSLFSNLLGTEGNAASTLFLFPGSRRQILLGKNLAVALVLVPLNLLLAVLLSRLGRQPGQDWLPLVLWLELGSGVMLAVGNLVSVWFPHRVVLRGWRMANRSSSQGLSQVLMRLLATFVSGALALPVAAGVILPTYLGHPIWLALTTPTAALYVTGLYLISLHFAEESLLAREVEIAEKLAQAD